jgi:large subunit ribosomal protein L10
LKKKIESFKIIGGGFDGEKIDSNKINFLATLPSMDELRGKIIGLISAPAQKIATVVKEPAGQMARLLSSQSKKLEESN